MSHFHDGLYSRRRGGRELTVAAESSLAVSRLLLSLLCARHLPRPCESVRVRNAGLQIPGAASAFVLPRRSIFPARVDCLARWSQLSLSFHRRCAKIACSKSIGTSGAGGWLRAHGCLGSWVVTGRCGNFVSCGRLTAGSCVGASFVCENESLACRLGPLWRIF